MFKTLVHVDWPHTAEPKNHDTRQGQPGSRNEITEIKIVNEKDSTLFLSNCEDLPVFQLLLASI